MSRDGGSNPPASSFAMLNSEAVLLYSDAGL